MNLFMLTKTRLFAAALLLISLITSAQTNSFDINSAMGRGINLGNTLESETEGSWGNGPAKEYYFDDYKAAGFTSLRVPIRWDKHTANTSPYAVNEVWMNRVEEIIDWGLDRDLYIVINAHHDDWIKTGYSKQNLKDRFDSIWSQIAVRFQDKSEKLLFEIINEPNGLTLAQINDLNARVLSIIRKTNPTRTVLYSGHNYAGASEMMQATVPNDPNLIAYYHSYDPWSFAGESKGTWGKTDRTNLTNKMNQIKTWSDSKNIPITLNEFGAMWDCDYNSRMYFYASYTEEALNHNFSFNVWDDGGWFKIYQRAEHDWNEIKDILIYTSPSSPTDMQITVVQDSTYQLSWTNRDPNIDSIFIERKKDNGNFMKIAALSPEVATYTDQKLDVGSYYYYKVIAHTNDSIDVPSYPIRHYIMPYLRNPFQGYAIPLPGTIEAEDYDFGGEGLTFHDTEAENIPGDYRPNEGVDVQSRNDSSGFHIGYVEAGEWMEYTVNVAETANYHITAYVASAEGGGKMSLKFGSTSTSSLVIPSTGDWNTFTTVERDKELKAGEQVLRVNISSIPPFNIDRIEVAMKTKVNELSGKNLDFIVNPISDHMVRLQSMNNMSGEIKFYNCSGQNIASSKIDTHQRSIEIKESGLLIYRIYTNDGSVKTGKIQAF
ncbi:MAG: cellulase family glycosylhydrolase [Prolixibacteraceae bacterium]